MAKARLKDRIAEHKLRKRRWIILAAAGATVVIAVMIAIQVLVSQGFVTAGSMAPNVAQFVATMIGVTIMGISVNGFYKEKAQIEELQKRAKKRGE